MKHDENSIKAVIVALLGNFAIAVIKVIVSLITLSSAMLAEAIHSSADCFNQIFLLIGNKRSKKQSTERHPFGYGKESFYWALRVADLLFLVGAIFSVYEGIHKLMHPEPLQHIYWIFIVLTISIAIEFKSWSVAYKAFILKKKKGSGFIKGLEDSTDTNLLVIILEDSAALMGLITVLITTTLAIFYPIFDGIGSILVGLILVYVSYKLSDEVRKLIIDESIPREKRHLIRQILHDYEIVEHINRVRTVVIGNEKYLIMISVDIDDDAAGYHVEDMFEEIRLDIKNQIPEVFEIYVDVKKANSEKN